MSVMVDCTECVWEATCDAHRGGVIACPAGRVNPQAQELLEDVPKMSMALPGGCKDYEWPLDQIEAYRAAYGR